MPFRKSPQEILNDQLNIQCYFCPIFFFMTKKIHVCSFLPNYYYIYSMFATISCKYHDQFVCRIKKNKDGMQLQTTIYSQIEFARHVKKISSCDIIMDALRSIRQAFTY